MVSHSFGVFHGQVDAVQTNLKTIGSQLENSNIRFVEYESLQKMHSDKEREHQVWAGAGSGCKRHTSIVVIHKVFFCKSL